MNTTINVFCNKEIKFMQNMKYEDLAGGLSSRKPPRVKRGLIWIAQLSQHHPKPFDKPIRLFVICRVNISNKLGTISPKCLGII